MNKLKGDHLAAAAAVTPSTEAMSRLFAEHHRRVLLAAYRITGSMADAEDVAQTVFLRLMSSQNLMENPGSYLYRAAINGALDLLRRKKAAATEPLDPAFELAHTGSGSSPESAVADRQLGDLLRLAISELPQKAAEMFALRYLEEMGNREIAALRGTSQAVVAVTLFNARSRLRKKLTEMDGRR